MYVCMYVFYLLGEYPVDLDPDSVVILFLFVFLLFQVGTVPSVEYLSR